ncbi:MAG TPA: endonuclease/exonuclease/phosphatase family protein [Ilumatobacter sp.]|nr:endonuclease/exonuclease/phosphatase family protein [Ilumatobacter sp.]
MRLLTANLYTGRASLPAFSAVLDAERPDVVVCQEVGIDMAAMLSTRFAHGVAVGDDHTHTGRAMLSHQPLVVNQLEMALRPGLRARVELAGVGVELLGIHLANPVTGPKAVAIRARQVASVLDHLDAVGTPAIVVGDMNATPAWPAYRRLRSRLRDGIADAARRAGRLPQRTWAVRPGWPAMLRIDHVLTAGVVLGDVVLHRVEGSDHLAVAASLQRVTP